MKKRYYILGIIGVIYLAILVGRSVYTNWQTNQTVSKLKTEMATLEVENQNLQSQIAYYQTNSFKEKEARRKLGLVKPDEKVVIISKEPPTDSANNPQETPSESKLPNYQLWWQFFFKKES